MDGAGEGGASTGRGNASTQAEVGNNEKQGNVIVTKAVGRARKTPVTRTNDFLWTVNCKKHPK
jgi:hypothetical protein